MAQFSMNSEHDTDLARTFGGMAKRGGLWKSDKQAAYWLRQWERWSERNLDGWEQREYFALDVPPLEEGQGIAFASGRLMFYSRHTGGLTGRNSKRLTWAYTFDGVGLVRKVKLRHAEKGGMFGPEIEFERESDGTDHWAEIVQRRAEALARREAEHEAAEEAPSGRVTITGEVVTDPEWRDQGSDRYGRSFGAFKCMVKDDRGFKVWISEPSRHSWKRGLKVQFDAALTVSDTDSKFAFGKRPTKITDGCESCLPESTTDA